MNKGSSLTLCPQTPTLTLSPQLPRQQLPGLPGGSLRPLGSQPQSVCPDFLSLLLPSSQEVETWKLRETKQM